MSSVKKLNHSSSFETIYLLCWFNNDNYCIQVVVFNVMENPVHWTCLFCRRILFDSHSRIISCRRLCRSQWKKSKRKSILLHYRSSYTHIVYSIPFECNIHAMFYTTTSDDVWSLRVVVVRYLAGLVRRDSRLTYTLVSTIYKSYVCVCTYLYICLNIYV